MEGISITKLLVIAVLVILLFGTSKLRTLGADLGAALKGFKKAVGDDSTPPPAAGNNAAESQSAQQSVEKKDV
ncbi:MULTISPECIES: Sec-independent protein translocase subunit TatA [Serratia]|jgi:Sec-independent protein translocase protein TatE|uniref:Probable Sec-independent protein translocase protein TatE n=1 Tax=Serratia surfactantfaciens TaxID=2741499 RepID=A0ABS0LWX7_9GAMM|nr:MULTISPECIES: Sec-independent protein translocase subunit TatA [Serratia]OKP49931.1 preprotein translocase subunit TatA [Serratia marcescens]AOE98198.1 preprotein translocase subunit TatA [Serratia surfactantfaciens]MBH1918948.1 Sec-independent protein translocase subunit TatA [Serratia surfactantfaciens]MBI6152169.1 Sec-independent protein translocase subunit TatA [Serratia surfactantfaciens]MTD09359.1 twin-arginine translocase subunit TatE [Serratia sp. YC16]